MCIYLYAIGYEWVFLLLWRKVALVIELEYYFEKLGVEN